MESGIEPKIRFGAAVREFCDDRCMFIKHRGQSWVAGRSDRKELASMEWRQRKAWLVGVGRGVELTDSTVKMGKWSDRVMQVTETEGDRKEYDEVLWLSQESGCQTGCVRELGSVHAELGWMRTAVKETER